MTSVICLRAPQKDSPGYIAARIMLNRAPMTPREVLALADFGPVKSAMTRLNRHIDSGWLQYIPGGRLVVSKFAVDHFGDMPKVAAYVGKVATPRENLHAMEPLSSKHFLNVKGPRADAPDCSIQAKPSHFGKVTP